MPTASGSGGDQEGIGLLSALSITVPFSYHLGRFAATLP
jgi:hypothetical protein